ncbi:hypothetical protein BE04_19710 [Sorangium cellulosum]|uniref:Uncharacterized protein n=2 Tax=Sorangium cellulosum TaxID=56 RepID=A0A150PFU3_SORCE|nr:hypothetical protein [Sorangium cellulosum]AGP41611.1 hypothetical protein SCE1572_48240 [Sorangium cellulosum So0157-2]KYF54509.1 hypothetical protein BE04_19710 [Sorangium cellulosum]
MTTATLQRRFTAILAFLVLWPPVHFALARTLDVNPWKLFGLAMYANVHETKVELWDETREPAVRLEHESLSPATKKVVGDLTYWRGTLGRFVDVAPFAARMLKENPGVERLLIRLGVQRLDTATSKLTTTWTTHRYTTASAP